MFGSVIGDGEINGVNLKSATVQEFPQRNGRTQLRWACLKLQRGSGSILWWISELTSWFFAVSVSRLLFLWYINNFYFPVMHSEVSSFAHSVVFISPVLLVCTRSEIFVWMFLHIVNKHFERLTCLFSMEKGVRSEERQALCVVDLDRYWDSKWLVKGQWF